MGNLGLYSSISEGLYGSVYADLMEWEEKWWENGGPPGITGCSGLLGLLQKTQQAGKICLPYF